MRLWLSHHHDEDRDRCVRVGRHLVCRRCLVLYPAVVVSWAVLAAVGVQPGVAVALSWLLPLPMLADWVGEHLGLLRASPRRLVAVTVIAAPGLASLLDLSARGERTFGDLAPALVYGALAVGVAWWGTRRRSRSWLERHHADEAARAARLRALLDDVDDGRR